MAKAQAGHIDYGQTRCPSLSREQSGRAGKESRQSPMREDQLTIARRGALIDAGISARRRYGPPIHVMRPTAVVVGALHRVRQTAVGHAQQSAAVAIEKIDLDQARSGRHLVVSVPAETVGQAVHRHDLPERYARYDGIFANAFDKVEPARMYLGRCLGAHPAQDLFRIGQEGENRRRRRRDLDFASDEERFVLPCLLERDQGIDARCKRDFGKDRGSCSSKERERQSIHCEGIVL
jgi:hypothetical protein